jgi:hypothetical protein
MNNHSQELEKIASSLLEQSGKKPNYTNRDFLNAVIIFQTAIMDKMYETQDYDGMSFDDRIKMSESCGKEIRSLIHSYTGFDMHKLEDFL